jgi:hypothetical protein
MNIENLISSWTKRNLVWQQKKNIASLTIIENYLTSQVLKGDETKKGHLIDIQNRLNESQKFLKFLTYK